jgi:hypothetical protein
MLLCWIGGSCGGGHEEFYTAESRQGQSIFMSVSCLACLFTLKMEAIYFSETSVDFHRTIGRYI